MDKLPAWLRRLIADHPVERLCRRVVVATDAPHRPTGATVVAGIRLICGIEGEPRHRIPGREAVIEVPMPAGTVLAVADSCPVAGEDGCEVMFNTVFNREHTRLVCWHRADHRADRVQLAGAACWPQARALFDVLVRQRTRPADDAVAVAITRALLALGRRALEEPLAEDAARNCYLRAIALIEDILPGEIARGMLAQALQVHPNHLSRIFTRHAEESLSTYVTRRRIELARRHYLLDPQAGVAAAGSAAGFSGPSYFSQCCQRLFGCPPAKLFSVG